MRIPRIFVDTPLAIGQLLELGDAQAHYLLKVLRLGVGRQVALFNGTGDEWLAQVVDCGKRAMVLKLSAQSTRDLESPLQLHLAQVVSKGERMDFTLQKAVELGVSEITPLWSARSEVRLSSERLEKKLAHWHAVMVSACEQSGRTRVPRLQPPLSLSAFIQGIADRQGEASGFCAWVLSPELPAVAWPEQPLKSGLLLIGPEGGLSADEVAQALAAGMRGMCLGPRTLRTETAGLVALSVLQHRYGDL